MPSATQITAVGLTGVILGLLAVGVVSGTPVRHLVQVAPAILALVFIIRRAPWAYYAALPIFVFWLLIMLAIWLYLLGIARIVSGHFTHAEIGLSFVIGASCLVGLSQMLRSQPVASRVTRAAWSVIFAALQLAALWLSLRPEFATV